MKVLKQGTLPEPPPLPWPIGVEIVCPDCACRFVPETPADFTITTGMVAFLIICPTCQQLIRADPPLEIQEAS